MTAEELIPLILDSKSFVAVFPDISNWKTSMKEYLLLIHTDRCSLTGAQDATTRLLKYKNELEKGQTHNDDAGVVTYFPDRCEIRGDKDLLYKSLENFDYIKSILRTKSNFNDFIKYFPKDMTLEGDVLKVFFHKRSVPISHIDKLPQEHLNWSLSRMLEIATFLNHNDLSHNGINPDSIYLTPENHGVIVISFYHMTKLDTNLKTISGNYSKFYPEIVFTNKLAKQFIDIELCKRTAVWLAGDKSGVGVTLKKTHNTDWVNFVTQFDVDDTWLVFDKYRNLLTKNFKKHFYELNI